MLARNASVGQVASSTLSKVLRYFCSAPMASLTQKVTSDGMVSFDFSLTLSHLLISYTRRR
jgi:hypothetical protein